MSRIGLRIGVAVLIAMTLAVRMIGLQNSGGRGVALNGTAAAHQAITDAGFATLPNPVAPPKVLSAAVYFKRPGCPTSSFVFPFGISVEARPLLDRIAAAGYTYRYYYLDGVWSAQSRVAIYAQWLRHTVLGLAGRSPYRTVKVILAVGDPVDCAGPETIDWRRIWFKRGGATDDGRPDARPQGERAAP